MERRLRMMGIYSLRVTVIVGVKKSRLGCRFQRHRPLHVVIVGPDGTYLVEREHRDLLEVQAVQLHPVGMRKVHSGEPGWAAPGLKAGAPKAHGTSDKPLIGGRSILQPGAERPRCPCVFGRQFPEIKMSLLWLKDFLRSRKEERKKLTCPFVEFV